MPTSQNATPWFKSAVVYQIYPKSFCDFDGDGLGDLKGIESKIEHLVALGVGAVWFSPFYPSPQKDNGYDISNYVDIDPRFGTLEDFDRLVSRLHSAGIRVIVDVVFNHSSDQHPWFQSALADRDSEYRDYYIWRDGRILEGQIVESEPNNWTAFFGGPSWSKAGDGGQYYLHTFTPEQPDLNWENPAVRAEIAQVMEFWIARGVDGFRMDVINLVSKAPGLPDGAVPGLNPDTIGIEHYGFGPRLLEFLTELRTTVIEPHNAQGRELALIGETPGLSPELARHLVADEGGPLDMIFHFEHVGIDQGQGGKFDTQPFDLRALKAVLATWNEAYGDDAWSSHYFDNHDQPRAVSRWGDGSPEAAKALAAMLILQRGTPFVYQGDEIGMVNAGFTSIDQYDDVESINRYAERIAAGQPREEILAALGLMGRDNARVPVRWAPGAGYGFTSGTPWIDFGQMPPGINASDQAGDPESVLSFYRELIALRREHSVFVDGSATFLALDDAAIFALERSINDDSLAALVLVNFSGGPAVVPAEVSARWPLFGAGAGEASGQVNRHVLGAGGVATAGTAGVAGSWRGAGNEPESSVMDPYEVVVVLRERS